MVCLEIISFLVLVTSVFILFFLRCYVFKFVIKIDGRCRSSAVQVVMVDVHRACAVAIVQDLLVCSNFMNSAYLKFSAALAQFLAVLANVFI